MQQIIDKGYDYIMSYDERWKEESGSIGFRMSNDYLFRALMQRDEKTLRRIVAAFLQVSPDDIEDVTVINPIILGESINDKEMHLDVRVIIDHGRNMNLEMQTVHHAGWPERSLSYACRSFDSLCHGDHYEDAPGIWQIAFCDFTLFEQHRAFVSTYMLLETVGDHHVYTDKFMITNVDMTSISLARDNCPDSDLVDWALLFKAKTWEELKMLAEKDKSLDETISSAWQLSKDREILEQMRRREENERLWNHTVELAEEAQRKLEEGLQAAAEEVAEAKNKAAKEVAEAENKAAEAENKAAEAERRAAEAESRLAELERKLAEMSQND